MFGITFRKEFSSLKDSFFKHLIDRKQHKNSSSSDLPCYLKAPLLLMTATFNMKLLEILEKTIGIKVLRENYLWSGRDKMARRNIRFNVKFTSQTTRHIKTVLSDTLSDNFTKKCIVYTNTASCLDQLKVDIEQWLDTSDDNRGDALIIQGDMKPEVKILSAEIFTKNVENPEDMIHKNEFYPRILIATAGSIGAGLDSDMVNSVVRVGFPTSLIDMVQEMGRCGRGRSNDDGIVTDNFHILLSCHDFVYLNQRLYLPSGDDTTAVKQTGSSLIIYDEVKLQRDNLLSLLKLIVLKGPCWHLQIETMLGNPCEPPRQNRIPCGNSCPVCLDTTSDYIMPVTSSGISKFLCETFINNVAGSLSPEVLIKKAD